MTVKLHKNYSPTSRSVFIAYFTFPPSILTFFQGLRRGGRR